MISVRHLSGEEYEVVVSGRRETTTHQVRLPEPDRKRLGGEAAAEKLIDESFHFLLERESNTSILRSFDLTIISKYFPEYEEEIRKRLT
jgi:hypothetical protein